MVNFHHRMVAVIAAIFLAFAQVGPAFAADPLPQTVISTLQEAARKGDDALLDAVEEAVRANPGQAEAIVEEAKRLKPALEGDILAAAVSGGGDVAVAPAAGPVAIVAPILGAAAVGGAAAAAGGGGGGSSGDTGTTTPPPPDPVEFETAEYFASRSLGTVNASSAYARGGTGQGIVVAVLDTGLDLTHPELQGQVAPGGFDFTYTTGMVDPQIHGTFVSGLIAAKKDDFAMHGVAYDAKILPMRIFDGLGNPTTSSNVAAAVNRAVAFGAHVINNSWGLDAMVTDVTAAQYSTQFPGLLQSFRNAVAAGRVLVWAAGNVDPGFSPNPNPSVEAGLPHLFPELQSHWLAVVSVGGSGAITNYSYRCGVAAAWCLAAPGGGDVVPGDGVISTGPGGYYESSGTSFAAPTVSGGVAILMDLFPNLTSEQIVARLLATANKTGIYANTLVYGQGLMDLEAASRPIGVASILVGDSINGQSFAVDQSKITLGSAFGDGLKLAMSGTQLAIFDDFRATFLLDLGDFIETSDNQTNLDTLLRGYATGGRKTVSLAGGDRLSYALRPTSDRPTALGDDERQVETVVDGLSFTSNLGGGNEVSLSYNTDPALGFGLEASGAVDRDVLASRNAFAAPYLSFASEGYGTAFAMDLGLLGTLRTAAFFGESDDEGTSRVIGTVTELAGTYEEATVSVQVGALTERDTLLGARTEGAFDLGDETPTAFTGVTGEFRLTDDLRLVGSAYAGITQAKAAANSLIADVSAIQTSAFTLGLMGENLITGRDRFGIVVNQPLRVEGGSADLRLTTGRDPAGNLTTQTVAGGLAPHGREIDFEMFYGFDLGDDTSVTASAMLRTEPGHVSGAEAEAIGLLRLQHRF